MKNGGSFHSYVSLAEGIPRYFLVPLAGEDSECHGGCSSVAGLGDRGHLAGSAIAVRCLEQVGKILGKMAPGFFPQMGLGVFWQNIYIYIYNIYIYNIYIIYIYNIYIIYIYNIYIYNYIYTYRDRFFLTFSLCQFGIFKPKVSGFD